MLSLPRDRFLVIGIILVLKRAYWLLTVVGTPYCLWNFGQNTSFDSIVFIRKLDSGASMLCPMLFVLSESKKLVLLTHYFLGELYVLSILFSFTLFEFSSNNFWYLYFQNINLRLRLVFPPDQVIIFEKFFWDILFTFTVNLTYPVIILVIIDILK